MTRSLALSVAFLLVCSGLGTAQAPAEPENPGGAAANAESPAQTQPAPDEDAEQRAYTAASRILDPAAKIQALEKFKQAYPRSEYLEQANLLILSTLAARVPGGANRAAAQAKAIYKASSKDARGKAAASIADALLNANAMTPEALSYARKALKYTGEASFIKEQTAAAASESKEPPSPEILRKRFRELRASRMATLGRAEAAAGNDKRAAELLKAAYAELPGNNMVAAALAEVEARRGEDTQAMDLLVKARLAGRAAPSTVSALHALYRKQHGGSDEGLQAMLDSEYRKRFPNPIQTQPYTPGERRANRMVLAEVFTGAGCGPCAGADLAFDAAMERYGRQDLAVLMYHQHVPRPDPMTNPDTQARARYYQISGVPTSAIDGRTRLGGGPRANAPGIFEGISKTIEEELELHSVTEVNASASVRDGNVEVRATVRKPESAAGDIRVHIVLAEKELTYSGENGIRFHPMVVRSMGSSGAEGYKAGGQITDFRERFRIADVSAAIRNHLDEYESQGHRGEPFNFIEKLYRIDPANLAVVVFAQDVKTKRVLQAAYIDLASASERRVTEN